MPSTSLGAREDIQRNASSTARSAKRNRTAPTGWQAEVGKGRTFSGLGRCAGLCVGRHLRRRTDLPSSSSDSSRRWPRQSTSPEDTDQEDITFCMHGIAKECCQISPLTCKHGWVCRRCTKCFRAATGRGPPFCSPPRSSSEPVHEAGAGVPPGAGHEEVTGVGPVELLPLRSLPSDFDIDFGPASSGWDSMTSAERAIYYGQSGIKGHVESSITPCDVEREPKPASSVNACVDAVSDSLHQVKAVSARNSRKHGLMPPHGTRSRRKLANMRGSSAPSESVAGVGLKSPRIHGGKLSNCAVIKAADALCANLREAREDRKTATPLTRSKNWNLH